MSFLRPSLLALGFGFFLVAGCSPAPATFPDAGPLYTVDAFRPPECGQPGLECNTGQVCAAVEGVPRCVRDPNPLPPGDGTDCRPCPAPGECRRSMCVQPSSTGAFCEFDDACADTELCIAGRCTHDPRTPATCTNDEECAGALTCGPMGTCVCAVTTDCPAGTICTDGRCVPPEDEHPCVADEECMPADCGAESDESCVCDHGRCRPTIVCDISHPDFVGAAGARSSRWRMTTELNVREALPDDIEELLETVEEPLRFLSGDASCIDFGLPDWVEDEICDLVRPLITEYVPDWARPLFRAIADLNRILESWQIDETMRLERGEVADSYRGTHEWERITIMHRGTPLVGTPETIPDWRYAPSPFNASAVCGTFHIERHNVNVNMGALAIWAMNILTYNVTDREHDTVGEALTAVSERFCETLADFADEQVDHSGVRDAVFRGCSTTIRGYLNKAVRDIADSTFGTAPITLRGEASVTGCDSLMNGDWYGTIRGDEFGGAFNAVRETASPCE